VPGRAVLGGGGLRGRGQRRERITTRPRLRPILRMRPTSAGRAVSVGRVPIPDYESMMRPLLDVLADGESRSARQVREALAPVFGITEDEAAARLPSGQPVFNSRAHWAATYLVQAGCLTRPRRGFLRLTDRGRTVLGQHPDRVDNSVLMAFPEFVDFKTRSRQPTASTGMGAEPVPEGHDAVAPRAGEASETPVERVRDAVQESETALAADLLVRVKSQPPEFLERLVLDLLTAMGYGGREGAAQHLGRSGDGGIDGVIRQDALALDRVYVQAKRYADSPVGRPDIQAFVGALHGAGASRGVFITTSRFTRDAIDYADRMAQARIVLVDGPRLGELMLRHEVGVQAAQKVVLHKIDEDYFTDE
jgi:restriction system protein